ncbi:type IV pilus biogenesis protein PilM [Chloroflexota bacterium]
MANRLVTLEISSTVIKLMETEGQKVIRWASRPIESGIFEGEAITDHAALGATVKQLMNSSGIKATSIIASISGLYSLTRIVMVPTPPGGSVTQQNVLDEIGQIIPFSEEELYLSWQTVTTASGIPQVLVVGIPQDMIDSTITALRTVNVKARTLDLKSMALIRAVNRELAIILNIEPSSFDTIMIVGGIPYVIRTSAWESGTFSLEDRTEHLIVALELTVDFYRTQHPDIPLDQATPLFITGQMSGDLALMEKLQERVEYPIEALKPPIEYPPHLPLSQYAVNIGLALKGATSSINPEADYFIPDMNLLPRIYQPWKPSPKQISIFLGLVAAITLLLPLYQTTTKAINMTTNFKSRYTTVKNRLQLKQVELSKRIPLEATINEYKTIIDMGGSFTEDIETIRTEAENLGINIESISHEGTRITYSCEAADYATFREYIATLKASGRFDSITSPPEQYSYVKGGIIKLEPKPDR